MRLPNKCIRWRNRSRRRGAALCLQRTAFFHSIRRCGRKIRIWPDGFPLKERQSTTPVMHTAQDEEYYLRRAFDRSNSVSGTPFLAAGCFTGCGNYIIYGHNMKDGSMFAALLNYADDTFWEEHPTIRFDTLEETGTYQVLAAFYIDVSLSEDGVAFPFYEYTGLRDEAIFQEYLAQVGDRALYSTGVTAEFGEQLLTLSTCSYNTSDERFVVVAKQVV